MSNFSHLLRTVFCVFSCIPFCVGQRFAGISSQAQKAGSAGSNTEASYTPTGVVRWQASLLADGDFSKSLSAAEGKAPKTGSLGASFTRWKVWQQVGDPAKRDTVPHFQGSFIVSLGSQGDTLQARAAANGTRIPNQAAFGQALLLPGSNAKAARSLTATLLWYPFLISGAPGRKGLGFNIFANVTQTRWGYQQTTEDVRLIALSGGVYYTVFDLPTANKGNSLKLDIYLDGAFRNIGGDIREEKQILDAAFRTNQYSYFGVDPGFVFTVNSLRLAANFPYFPGGGIKGFSNGQFVANLGFTTALNLTK